MTLLKLAQRDSDMTPISEQPTSRSEVEAAQLTARLSNLAFILLDMPPNVTEGIDRTTAVRNILRAFAQEGIAREASAATEHANPSELALAITKAWEAVEHSPLPDREWPKMTRLLGDDLLEILVGTSSSSLYRYRSGDRHTPDHIAERLHAVTLIAADLAGSYNGFGIRRWFTRPRAQLDGSSPADVLKGDWDPDDESVERVKQLAAALTGPMAT
ncbi:hypothetical protein [Arthrobacter sp. NicSoilB11]|uniref:hypothetical protein n=1 Tax=Arthrobacter sp. NicSoilB11 TaxID=2830999 RepID=UPI001CC38755|nr:hypothetical protein [Arthrobacter sp. NicSoilB11]